MSKIQELFELGTRNMVAAHDELEKTKVGILRAGNTGLLLADGRVTGKCARLTYLRFKGIQVEEADHSRELMFAAGRTNEDSWMEVLRAADPTLIIRREEEIPIGWKTDNGTSVTGRPDIVLGHVSILSGQFVPEIGIELKQACSLWTCRDVGILMRPKVPHLMQAAHYSWQLGIPFELWYTNRTDFAVMGWAQKNFPRPGEPGSDRCEYNDKGEIKKVLPFNQGYELEWASPDSMSSALRYRAIGSRQASWTDTIVTRQAIVDYFSAVAAMDEGDRLPPAPVNLEADGGKGPYSICGYCPLEETCAKHTGTTVSGWTAAAVSALGKK